MVHCTRSRSPVLVHAPPRLDGERDALVAGLRDIVERRRPRSRRCARPAIACVKPRGVIALRGRRYRLVRHRADDQRACVASLAAQRKRLAIAASVGDDLNLLVLVLITSPSNADDRLERGGVAPPLGGRHAGGYESGTGDSGPVICPRAALT